MSACSLIHALCTARANSVCVLNFAGFIVMLTIHRLAFLNIQTGTENVLTKLYKYRVINQLAQGILINQILF